jgi:bifunctional non-homologous end joining protein LigD
LACRTEGIFIAPFEQGEIGPDLFRKACERRAWFRNAETGHIVPAHRHYWVKVKNRNHSTLNRVRAALSRP